jgi:hypothetical protein
MLAEQLAPAGVAELDGRFRRTDDVGEENGGQDAVRLGLPCPRLSHIAEEPA